MDKSVLIEKRKNLLNQNKNTNEIYLNSKFINILEILDQKTLEDFLFKDINSIIIQKGSLSSNIKNQINAIDTLDDLKKFTELQNYTFTNFPENYTPAELEDLKEKISKKIIDQKFKILDELTNLQSFSQFDYFENSIWKLFLSYGILTGVSEYTNKDLLYLRAPLINIEINVEKTDDGSLKISKRDEGTLIANEILINTLESQYEIVSNLNEFFNTKNNEKEYVINEYLNLFTTIFPNTTFKEYLPHYTKVSKEKLARDLGHNLFIDKKFVISLINPLGGKILRDYDQLLSEDYQFPVVDSIFTSNLNNLIYEKDSVWELNRTLNLSQKLAVVNSFDKNVLIYGPPGTGKSEVVTSLIANAIARRKTTLVVSEKRAALDVIDERLGNLNNLVMSAFDNKTKEVFYQRILNINQKILYSNMVNLPNQEAGYNELYSYFLVLDELNKFNDVFGNSAEEIIDKSKEIKEELFTKYLLTIKRLMELKNQNKEISYEQLVEKIYSFIEIRDKIQNLFQVKETNKNIFNKEKINEVLKNLENEKDQEFILCHFIKTGNIVEKKGFFNKHYKEEKDIDINELKSLLESIKENNINYISNVSEIKLFFENCSNHKEYLSYYNWTTKTKLKNFINLINKKITINNLLHDYWNKKQSFASKLDKILLDFYTFNLKQEMIKSRELDKSWTELIRKANLQKKPSINRIIKNHYDLLRIVFPIWLLSPDSAASILPLNKGEFDIGVFDESSQMRVEKGLPLIYRCKSSIISGDDKQLKPTDFFQKVTELGEEYEGHLDNVDSLLDKAKTSNWMSFTLMNHYRSIYEELIYFSNYYFYDKKLICITKNHNNQKSIITVEAEGIYNREKGINEKEANLVVKYLVDNIEKYKKIIVITFNQKQADHITVLCNVNNNLRQLIDKRQIKIRSLENVQGDEGDLVIISSTFGKDNNGKFIQNFGPVNQFGGMNRINVMITRAKDQMIVIKSMKANDITNVENLNTKVLHDFIQYIEQLQVNSNIISESISQEQNITESNNLVDLIRNEFNDYSNIEFLTNQKIGTNKIDVVIKNKETNQIKVLLVIDDKTKVDEYVKNRPTMVQSMDRQKYYEDRNYKTMRINSIEWAVNKDITINKIKELIQI
ncbi:MAG: AAA domain-containing protein [Mycoplasma sp.]